MRRLLKFLHTIGAIGMAGSMACLLVLLIVLPSPSSPAPYAQARGEMGAIASWIFLPSLAMTLVTGLLAMSINRAYHNAGWVWVKLASGLLVFEGGLASVVGTIQEEAERSAGVLVNPAAGAVVSADVGAERGALWVLLAIAVANVILGVWRPRLTRLRA